MVPENMKTINIFKKDNFDKENGDGKDWPQVLAIITASLTSFTTGLLFSWTSPFLVKIVNDKEHYDISEDEASYFSVIPPIAMLITGFVFSNLNDIIGRKRAILLIAVPHIVAWILAALADNIWMFYGSRIFSGIGDGCMFSSVPMYIGEISTPKIRGVWGNFLTFSIYLGQLLITVIGSYFNVAETSYICLSFPAIFLILFAFMPESPYYYIMKGKFDEAKDSLKYLKRKDNVDEEFTQLKADVDRQMSESGTWKDLFFIDSNRKALFSGIFLRASQQFAGTSTFAVYTQYIFAKSGGDLGPEVSSIIFFGTICILNGVAGYTLDIIGRKRSYIISLVFCGIVLLIEAIYFYIDQYQTSVDIKFLNWIPITGMMLFVLFYSIGLGIVPTLMLGELFSASIKPKGLCFLSAVFAILISVTTKLFHVFTTNFGLFAPFLFFSTSCFLSTILSLYLVPETKGKTLEEIQQLLKSSPKKTDNNSKTKDKDNGESGC